LSTTGNHHETWFRPKKKKSSRKKSDPKDTMQGDQERETCQKKKRELKAMRGGGNLHLNLDAREHQTRGDEKNECFLLHDKKKCRRLKLVLRRKPLT